MNEFLPDRKDCHCSCHEGMVSHVIACCKEETLSFTLPDPGLYPVLSIGQYSDFHSESWSQKDGQWVWNEKGFETPEESERWKEHTAKNGSVFGLKP